MDSTNPELKVHIIPIGPEEDRAVLPVARLRGQKAYLVVEKNPHGNLKCFKERIAERLQKEAGLRREDIILNEYYGDWNDFSGIVSKFAEIVMREQDAGNKVLINISSGSKFASIAGTLVALMYGAEAYYVEAEEYVRLERKAPDTRGMKDVISIPGYRIDKPDPRWIYALSILKEYSGGIKQRALAEHLIDAEKRIRSAKAGRTPLLRGTEENDPKKKLSEPALNNILRRDYLAPMEAHGLIEQRGQRRGAVIYITKEGKAALDMFIGGNWYYQRSER